MDILDAAVRKSGKTVSEYVRELIRLGGNVDFRYPEDRARVIRIFSGIANNINIGLNIFNNVSQYDIVLIGAQMAHGSI